MIFMHDLSHNAVHALWIISSFPVSETFLDAVKLSRWSLSATAPPSDHAWDYEFLPWYPDRNRGHWHLHISQTVLGSVFFCALARHRTSRGQILRVVSLDVFMRSKFSARIGFKYCLSCSQGLIEILGLLLARKVSENRVPWEPFTSNSWCSEQVDLPRAEHGGGNSFFYYESLYFRFWL